jgi:hypothetical protein
MSDTALVTPVTFGNVIENLRLSDLRISPALPLADQSRSLAAAPISNQQALDAMKAFYNQRQVMVDATTTDTQGCANNRKDYVGQMNGFSWKSQQLSSQEQSTTGSGIFGDSGSGGGIWGPTLCKVKSSNLMSTIAVGVNADVQVFIGGAGGLGCAWDIVKREPARGYGYATGEIGLRVDASINIQCLVSSLLPSQLNLDTWGITVSMHAGLGASFSVFFQKATTDVLAYAVAVGLGAGGGATVFGGHIWNFS